MPRVERRRGRARDLGLFGLAIFLPVPWVVAQALGGLGIEPEVVAALAGLAILGSAFLLSWSCEVAEQDIPQALALLVLALVGVLPEYAIDLHFAWVAGKDPTYASYAVANMTGANRLLIGFGWAAVVLVACWRSGSQELEIHPRQNLELRFLIWATLYSFVIPLSGSIHLFDAFVLLGLFLLYVRTAMKGETHDVELVGPAALIERAFSDWGRRCWALGLFAFAAYAIFVSAEPFAESLVHIGRNYDIDEFLLVQWVAPLASESPEFVVAVLFALKLRGSVGIGALISSKVNQWTLLVGAIPIAYAISLGAPSGLPLDARQVEELLLTSSQSLLAVVMLADLRFSRREALMLAALFTVQLVFPSTLVRGIFIALYLGLSAGILIVGPEEQRRAFFRIAFSRPGADTSSLD
jgi:cation:H+ antiporter